MKIMTMFWILFGLVSLPFLFYLISVQVYVMYVGVVSIVCWTAYAVGEMRTK